MGSFAITTPAMSGTVAAIFASAAQLGAAILTPVVTAISTDVEAKVSGRTMFDLYAGDRAAYYTLIGILCLLIIGVFLFYDTITIKASQPAPTPEYKKDLKDDTSSTSVSCETVPANDTRV